MVMTPSHQAHELILHLGLAKTGTTSLQKALLSNKDALYKRFRLLYPGTRENHGLLQAAFCEEPISLLEIQRLGISDHSMAVSYLRKYRQSLIEEITDKKPRRIVISTEFLSGMRVSELHAVNDFLKPLAKTLTPVMYIRDPWSFSVSIAQEMIRNGQLADVAELGYKMSNVELIDKFAAAFGVPIKVLPYRSSGTDFDVVTDFLSVLGIAAGDISDFPCVRDNVSINREAAFALLQCNKLFPLVGPDGKLNLRAARDWIAQSIQQVRLPGTPIRHSAAEAEEILNSSRAHLERIQYEHFGGDEVLTDAYRHLEIGNHVGRLSAESVEPTRVYAHLLHAMYALAEMTEVQYTERLYWTAMYYLESKQLTAAASCFRELLNFPGPRARAQDAQARLDSIAALQN